MASTTFAFPAPTVVQFMTYIIPSMQPQPTFQPNALHKRCRPPSWRVGTGRPATSVTVGTIILGAKRILPPAGRWDWRIAQRSVVTLTELSRSARAAALVGPASGVDPRRGTFTEAAPPPGRHCSPPAGAGPPPAGTPFR